MKDFRPCIRALFSLFRPIRWSVGACSLLYLGGVACSLAFVWLSKQVVDIATGVRDAPLERSVVLLVSVMLCQILFRVFAKRVEGEITEKAKLSIRRDAFDKALCSKWSGMDKFHSADVVNRLEEDIRIVSEFLCITLPSAFVTLVQLVCAAVMLFSFSSSLAMVLIWIMPVAVIGARLFFRRFRALSLQLRTIDGKIQGLIQEHLQSRVLVKTLGAEDIVEGKLNGLQSEELAKTQERLNYSVISRLFMQIGFSAGYLTAFLWGVYGLRDGTVTYGLMVAFLQLVGQVQRPVADMASYIPSFIKAISSEERLMDIDDMARDFLAENKVLTGQLSLSVEHLDFSYDGRKEIFKDFSCEFRAGELTAICGQTGRGKSTLANLILGVLKPDGGHITISNGSETLEVGPQTRSNFMYVPQGNTLLSGTIRENLLLANPSATEQMLFDVLHSAAADFVFDLPLGMDTACSEVGRGLSEGQCQRIAIARALLKEGGILILDESTSALDPATEMTVLDRLHDRYYETKTIICITHRMTVSSLADKVIEI